MVGETKMATGDLVYLVVFYGDLMVIYGVWMGPR